MQFAAGTELNWFVQGLRVLMAWLCEIIYSIIANLYNLFMNLTKINLLDNDTMSNIYQRITLILSIVMVFYVTFQFVKYVVQPDAMTDKEKGVGNIVFKMVAVVLLIAYVPIIFGAAMKVQNVIIEQNVIGKILLGKEYKMEDNYGGSFAFKMLDLFYNIPDEYAGDDCDGIPCIALYNMNQKSLIEENKLPYLTTGINAGKEEIVTGNGKTGKVKVAYIDFKGLEAVLVGGVIAYMLLLYCIDVGTRWAQLIYLQIVSPIPIIGYLSPKKDGIFQQWCRQCFTTYIDIFIRISIIYLVLFISSLLLNTDTNYILENVKDESKTMQAFIIVALILGLLMFAKKAPKLISELFPKSKTAASGNFGLSAKDRGLKGVTRVAGAATGATLGAAAGLATGFAQGLRRRNSLDKNGNKKGIGAGIWGAAKGAVGGTLGGATRGLVNGSKKGNVFKNSIAGAKNQIKANRRFGNREENGYTFAHQLEDKARELTGARSRTEVQELKKAPLEKRVKERNSEIKYRKARSDEAFENAVNKNKGSENQRIRDAVTRYNKFEQREKDLTASDSALRQSYKAGGIKESKKEKYSEKLRERDAAIGRIDLSQIKDRISEDTLGLDKEAFKKQKINKEYDKEAHEAARSSYMKDSSILDKYGNPIKVFDKEAWERDQNRFTKDKITMEFDEDSYKSALEIAKNKKAEEIRNSEIERVNQKFAEDTKDCTYKSDEEAENARLEELSNVRNQKKKAKDAVSYAYEDWAVQGTTDSTGHVTYNDEKMARDLRTRIDENRIYNESSSVGNIVDREKEIKDIMRTMAIEQILSIDPTRNSTSISNEEIDRALEDISRAEAEDKWVKTLVNENIEEAETEIRDINAEQEKIKNETSGNQDKK